MTNFQRNQTVRSLVAVSIPGWTTTCPPGYCFTVEDVNADGTIVLSRSGPDGRVVVKATDIEPAYRVVNGVSYSSRAPEPVVNVLESVRRTGQRIRVRLGDRVTGRDWLEEHDIEGTVGNSMGPTKIPLLIHSRRSTGGPGLLDDAVVKITTSGRDKRILYQHESYHTGRMELVVRTDAGYAAVVNVDGQLHARFETVAKAERWLKKWARLSLVIRQG